MRALAVLGLLLAAVAAGCRAEVPEAKCTDKCVAKIASRCSQKECARGCEFILDRIVEREDEPVLSCMTTAKTCDDPAWAECAVKVGVHATGAPPANTQAVKSLPLDDE